MGDIPNWLWWAMFSLFPFQLFPSGMELSGHGVVAASCQGIALLALLILTICVWRSPKQSLTLKLAILFVGYPIVTLLTNIIPSYISKMH
ncbi:MAG TPA: hypothetical protein VNN22_14325 [Verrucomicrobiae bacterium]|nr:hypothetical protein [Verrucomicrobiae bacterium]